MYLIYPGLPLFHLNKIIVTVKLAEEIGFPNFPLSITKATAIRVVGRISEPWWEEEVKERIAHALISMSSTILYYRICVHYNM